MAAETVHTEKTAVRLKKSAELDEHRSTYGSDDEVTEEENVAKQEYAAQKNILHYVITSNSRRIPRLSDPDVSRKIWTSLTNVVRMFSNFQNV